MKKIFGLVLLCLALLTSCSKEKGVGNEIAQVTNYLSNLKSYSLTSKMTINRQDKSVNLNVDVDYLSPSYYKVSFKGDSEQVIIKNDSGVFVITPSLNKEFKFDSNWPLNSSHAYLLEAINKDIKADNAAVVTTSDSTIKIECKINHKTNQKLNKMAYVCNKNYVPIKTAFLNSENQEVIIVDFESFTPNSKLNKDTFNEKNYLNQQQEGPSSGETGLTITAGYVLEGSNLVSSSFDENTSILCYSGEKPYTIVVNKVEVYPEIVVFESYETFEYLECGLGFIDENGMRYFMSGYEINIYSNVLTPEEYLSIADSISLA